MKRRSLPVILVLIMVCAALLIPVLTSCSNSSGSDGTKEITTPSAAVTDDPSASETEEATTEAKWFEELNFNNTDFNFYAWKQSIIEYEGEEGTGDMIQSAVFRRNANVEEKLGVTLKFTIEAGNSSTFQAFCTNITNVIKGGSGEYDALACYTRSASLLMMNGVLSNMLAVDHLDFTADCWPQSLVKLNTIGGKLYFSSGDIATSLLYQMMFMAINNDVAKDRKIEGVQEKALNGEWTLDYLLEITKDAYVDNDPIGTKDPTDSFGLFTVSHPRLDIFYIGAGLKYVEINPDGKAVISDDVTGDASLDIIDRIQKLLKSNDAYFNTDNGQSSYMRDGKSLLYVIDGTILQNHLNVSDFDYSILCAPKYNTDQKDYYTAVGFPHSMYCIPFDASDKSMSGAVIQLMAEESAKEVTPVVFDTSFKYRYSKGSGDVDMFDIIRRGVVFDLGRTFFDQLGGDSSSPVRMWRNDVYQGTTSLVRSIRQYKTNWTKKLDDAISTIEQYEN